MATTDSAETGFSTDLPPEIAAEERRAAAGTGPWRIAMRRLRRNKVALAFGALFLVLVAISLAAPLYAKHVAKTTPYKNNITGTVNVGGKQENVVAFDGVPIGPTWQGQYFLGADRNGRDVMVRLLYGGRNSLLIGIGASIITLIFATIFGLIAGFFGGWIDAIISRCFDIMWAFPVILLGIALGVSLNLGGINLGPIHLEGGSLWIPTIIIGVSYIVYLARPIRGQVMSLREKEFIEAARAQGLGPWRIMFTELLPNLASTILVFFPLIVANAVLLEAALSFLGAGVQPPEPSWGIMIAEGIDFLTSAPHLTIAPGLMLVATVLSLNIFGEGLRDALDPRAKIRLEH
ncbi:ABC transporter permease [Capillimicrobium parvum]|uniref:Glutathione transport system permease protein GsiD n=1 Tax=Capillimicrobium parvum TaxID=2884022 RepID=A0A9E6Y9J9_9ACTN|nr:ABC transporter permease [Capillimicrobium parvum]UGS39262.1 Glutathione transport system permease protein GsiD [Capillimicrobium parvum]